MQCLELLKNRRKKKKKKSKEEFYTQFCIFLFIFSLKPSKGSREFVNNSSFLSILKSSKLWNFRAGKIGHWDAQNLTCENHSNSRIPIGPFRVTRIAPRISTTVDPNTHQRHTTVVTCTHSVETPLYINPCPTPFLLEQFIHTRSPNSSPA